MPHPEYKNFAFISYSHCDMVVAKWLQKHLERFRLPTEIHNDIEAGSRYLRPIFRDESDLTTGVLSDELRKHLEQSKYLILLCSRHSAQSKWVSDEAEAFVKMGRIDKIIPVIIPAEGMSEQALFPLFLREYVAQNPSKELLGINIRKNGKERTLIRVVSRMLGVSFDSLWKRHLRQKRAKIAGWTAAACMAMVAMYLFAIPVKVSLTTELEPADLPMGDEIVVGINGAEYVSAASAPCFETITLPGYRRFTKMQLSVASLFYHPVDTLISVGFGTRNDVCIRLHRDDTFAFYGGTVYDAEMHPLADVEVIVAHQQTFTNQQGEFFLSLPLAEQRAELPIRLQKEGFQPLTREDEIPNKTLKYILQR